MFAIGRMNEYDSGSDLEEYMDRLEQYFVANEIGALPAGAVENEETCQAAEWKQMATFITLVGAETYKLLKSLVSPDVPSTRTFQQLTDTLRNHLKPRKLVVGERFRFHKRQQRDGEMVSQFEAELRSVASTCEFGEFFRQVLRDQVVCRIRNKRTQQKLLSHARKKL